MSNTEQRQRIDATNRLNELAMSTMERHTHPVILLSRALENCRVFLPAEVCSCIEIILDATCIGEVSA
jgi:hypothetical protein